MKQCRRCRRTKSLDQFNKRTGVRDGRQYTCIDCMKQYQAEDYAANRDLRRAKYREWYRENREAESIRKRNARLADRSAVFGHYGEKCACCGESNIRFLSVDHVNEDGAQHRKTVKPEQIFRWLVKSGFPAGFQILCFNCNMGKTLNNGTCPHMEVT